MSAIRLRLPSGKRRTIRSSRCAPGGWARRFSSSMRLGCGRILPCSAPGARRVRRQSWQPAGNEVNAISAVNANGAFWYDVYTGKFNAQLFISKLKAFMRNRRRPVFLVLDSHPAHRAKIVAAYVQSLEGQLELHFLPGYAPDLNPDEFVWNHLRQNGVTKTPLKQNEQLKDRVEKDLAQIKRSPRLVRSFFRAESVGYIMD